MLQIAPGWSMQAERGPDWLFVKLRGDRSNLEGTEIAQHLWELLEQHLTYRLVLELNQVPLLQSSLLAQLVLLHKRIHQHQGLFRLSGLSEQQQETLRCSGLESLLPCYRTCEEAVMGCRPSQPR